jgi:hypothetical protein
MYGTQGMSYLVATLLLYMDEFDAFKCMANLLGRKYVLYFFPPGVSRLADALFLGVL